MSTVTTPSRRRFNDELKLQAVRLVREQKLPVVQVCHDFNISNSSLPVAENVLNRQLTHCAPNRAWACDIDHYIVGFYNTRRLHSALHYQAPVTFENNSSS